MKPKVSVFIATSLDGYIARADGDIEWLNSASGKVPPEEDCGYKDFIASVDVLVMGRKTFEQVMTFGDWPYGALRVIVLSRRCDWALPSEIPDTVSLSNESPEDIVSRLAAAGNQKIYVDGGLLIQSFLAAGLIDELVVTVIPILLGSGKPLFGALPEDIPLQHVATQAWDFGFVQNTYRISKS